MRFMKMFGLCLALAVAMAAFGAGTASATKLCSVNTSPCPAGNTYGKGTSIKNAAGVGNEIDDVLGLRHRHLLGIDDER